MELLVLIHTLRAALESGDFSVLPVRLADTHAADLAGALVEFSTAHQWQLLSCFPLSTQADVFSYLPEEQQVELAHTVTSARLHSGDPPDVV